MYLTNYEGISHQQSIWKDLVKMVHWLEYFNPDRRFREKLDHLEIYRNVQDSDSYLTIPVLPMPYLFTITYRIHSERRRNSRFQIWTNESRANPIERQLSMFPTGKSVFLWNFLSNKNKFIFEAIWEWFRGWSVTEFKLQAIYCVNNSKHRNQLQSVSIMCCHVEFQNEVVFRKHGCFEVAKNRRHAKQIHKPQSYRTRSFQTIWGESSKAYKLLHWQTIIS